MATNPEQQSSHESFHDKGKPTVTVLDERRRAALSEIDNAPFSYVLQNYYFTFYKNSSRP